MQMIVRNIPFAVATPTLCRVHGAQLVHFGTKCLRGCALGNQTHTNRYPLGFPIKTEPRDSHSHTTKPLGTRHLYIITLTLTLTCSAHNHRRSNFSGFSKKRNWFFRLSFLNFLTLISQPNPNMFQAITFEMMTKIKFSANFSLGSHFGEL
jgi:hypothetical protein